MLFYYNFYWWSPFTPNHNCIPVSDFMLWQRIWNTAGHCCYALLWEENFVLEFKTPLFTWSIQINCLKSENPISSAIRIHSTWALKYKTAIIAKYWSRFYAFMTFMGRILSYNHLKSMVLRYILHSIRIRL